MSHHHHHHGGELATVFACPPCAGAAGLDITGAQTVVDGQGYGWIVHRRERRARLGHVARRPRRPRR
jgi:hypothetical protein